MYAVSEQFMDQMRATVRKVLARVTIDYTDPTQDQTIEVTASEQANVSYPAQTADFATEPAHKWAALDGAWVLDGTWHLAPVPEDAYLYQMGWWSAQVAGPDGSFGEPYPTLVLTHPARLVLSLGVVGDAIRGEWPTVFAIRLYGPDGMLLRERVVEGNTQVHWQEELDPPALDVTRQELEILAWSHPGRHAKILEFFTSLQETYEGNDLLEVHLLEERESGSGVGIGGVTTNELTVRLVNRGGRFDVTNKSSPLREFLRPNRRVRAWLGAEVGDEIEWVPLGTYWSGDWDSQDLEATVRARDRLELLRRTSYRLGPLRQNVSLYALAEDVMRSAELPPQLYWIDPALQDIVVPWGWVPPGNHRDALRVIAEAGMARVYCDRDGILRIERVTAPTGDPVLEITKDDYFPPARNPFTSALVANRVVVTTQPLVPASSPEEVYRATVEVPAGQTIAVRAEYNKRPVIDAAASLESPPAGVSIVEVTYGAVAAEVQIRNTGASMASVTLAITGRPLSVEGGEQVVEEDDLSIRELGLIVHEVPSNPLVQTREHARAISLAILARSAQPRRDVELEWRGNPALEVDDVVSVDGMQAQVVRQELSWAGALSARLVARRLTS